jgi:RimJ/RimL family protein N-acetyltransferase
MGVDASARSYFAITLDDALIGGIDARSSRATGAQTRLPNLGYWLGQPYWGRGYMTEAARAFVGHVFASTACDTIYSGVLAGNTASLKVQEKLGFERDGEEMVYFGPLREKRLHLNTKFARARFLAGSQ